MPPYEMAVTVTVLELTGEPVVGKDWLKVAVPVAVEVCVLEYVPPGEMENASVASVPGGRPTTGIVKVPVCAPLQVWLIVPTTGDDGEAAMAGVGATIEMSGAVQAMAPARAIS